MIVRCRPLLGTYVEVTVPAGHGEAIDRAWDAMAHVHARMSFHDPASDLAALRQAKPGLVVDLAPETVSVLRLALRLFEDTDGLFDVAVGRHLVRAGFLPRNGIGHLGRYVGTSADVVIHDDTRISLRRRTLIDLGGIAKGFAVDRAVEVLMAAGVPEGLVNAGGDLRGFGGRDWQVGLRDADDEVRSILTIRDGAVASSANLLNRRRFRGMAQAPHIGRGGAPVLRDDRVTVIAPSCAIADAMTKVAMAAPALAETLLQMHDGLVLRDRPQQELP